MNARYQCSWNAIASGDLLVVVVGCTSVAQNPAPQLQVQKAQSALKQSTSTANLCTVTRIYDGDAIDPFKDGQTIRARAACIDVLEKAQTPPREVSRAVLSS